MASSETQERPRWPDGFVRTLPDRRAILILSGLRGITPRKLIEVGAQAGSAAATLERIRAGRAGSGNDRRFALGADAEAIEAAVAACGARSVHWRSPEYPVQLEHIADPPAVIYVVGGPLPEPSRAVAVVGARRCSELGREIAAQIGRGLALAGVTVVSGAAHGIDAAAHHGALEGEGPTLAVLGCGIDHVYPRGSRRLVERIKERGTVVSEYPPGVPPGPHHFPARNRIVAGLCRATVVVEGAARSGSLITAEHALDFGRDVFAVPGPVTSPLSEAPLRLIREGATMIRGAEDLLQELGLDGQATSAERTDLSPRERDALSILAGPTLPERVAKGLGVDVGEALSVLMGLELRGLVRAIGGRFESTLPGSDARRGSRGGPERS